MAHRIQRRTVRDARTAVECGVRALRAAALGLTLVLLAASGALAQPPAAGRGELVRSGAPSPSAWWGLDGRVGWLPYSDLGAASPWNLAGLVAGAWVLDEAGRPPLVMPPPGVVGAQSVLAWYDTLEVEAGGTGAWRGFDAALARARARSVRGAERANRRPRTDLLLVNGSRGYRDNGLGLWRGDSLHELRIEAASGERRETGSLAGAGRDLYGIAASAGRGAHRVEASFAHRRALAALAGGESGEARGESGGVGYRFERRGWTVGAALARGYDWHDSRGGAWPENRRLSDRTVGELEVEHVRGGESWGLRGTWSESGVTPDAAVNVRTRGRAWWGSARWRGPAGDGVLEAVLGTGHHDALRRLVVVPSLAWRFRSVPWDGRVTVTRLATPVWTDLAPGEAPFLQDAWCGGIEVGAVARNGGSARVGFLAGHATRRAILGRIPLEALALRAGFRADPRPYDFGLLLGEVRWQSGRWAAGVEGFLLARDAGALQPRVDPGRGGRALLEGGFRTFGGDLGVRARVEAWTVGPRQTESVPSLALAPSSGLGAAVELTLAEAILLIEGRNLRDRAVPFVWLDSATGRPALGSGREMRLTLVWRLWD